MWTYMCVSVYTYVCALMCVHMQKVGWQGCVTLAKHYLRITVDMGIQVNEKDALILPIYPGAIPIILHKNIYSSIASAKINKWCTKGMVTRKMKNDQACCSCLLTYKGSSWIFFKGWGTRHKARTLCCCPYASPSLNSGVPRPVQQLALKVEGDLPCAALTHFHGANTLKVASFNLPSSNSSRKPFGIVSWLYLVLDRWNPVWILLPVDLRRGKGMLTTAWEDEYSNSLKSPWVKLEVTKPVTRLQGQLPLSPLGSK